MNICFTAIQKDALSFLSFVVVVAYSFSFFLGPKACEAAAQSADEAKVSGGGCEERSTTSPSGNEGSDHGNECPSLSVSRLLFPVAGHRQRLIRLMSPPLHYVFIEVQ